MSLLNRWPQVRVLLGAYNMSYPANGWIAGVSVANPCNPSICGITHVFFFIPTKLFALHQLFAGLEDAGHVGGAEACGEVPAGGGGIVEIVAFDDIVEGVGAGVL